MWEKVISENIPPELTVRFKFSLDRKIVRIYAYSSTGEQSNKRSGMRVKTTVLQSKFSPQLPDFPYEW